MKPLIRGDNGYPGRSPPMRGRGLKPRVMPTMFMGLWSPPMRGRGLKQAQGREGRVIAEVAPHAGAWIETAVKTGRC